MINAEYGIMPNHYYWRGKENFETYIKDRNKPFLFYSALEFRCCIERFLFEQLVFLKIDDIPKKFSKIYRVTELKNWILKIEPDFYKKMEFTNLFLRAIGIDNQNFIPDLDLLNKLYGKLGNCLHLLKEPDKTIESLPWWQEFEETIRETEEYTRTMIGGMAGNFELNDDGFELFFEWKNGILSDKDIIGKVQETIFFDK